MGRAVMWRNTELKICHLSLEVVKGWSLIKICNNQGKRIFPTFKRSGSTTEHFV